MNTFVAQVEGKAATLLPEESFHCAKVLRMKSGEKLRLIDGTGNAFVAELVLVSDKKTTAVIIEGPLPDLNRNYSLHLAIAPTKQIDRIEWMLEKCVETGIDEVTFLSCKNSERKSINVNRLEKIALSAVKQSLQAKIPKMHDMVKLSHFLKKHFDGNKFIAHCGEGAKEDIRKMNFAGTKNIALVGPEGDFGSDEIAEAAQAGFKTISLGPNRLRTETAGLFICQAISIRSS
jgi:16S rRNA (uracil1498-N3)-methyltransferase